MKKRCNKVWKTPINENNLEGTYEDGNKVSEESQHETPFRISSLQHSKNKDHLPNYLAIPQVLENTENEWLFFARETIVKDITNPEQIKDLTNMVLEERSPNKSSRLSKFWQTPAKIKIEDMRNNKENSIQQGIGK